MMHNFYILAQESGMGAVAAFFSKGGFFMIPLVLCSIISVAMIILRGIALRRANVIPDVLENEIERLPPGGPLERLLRLVGGDESALARISETALQHRKYVRGETVEAVQTRARHEVVRLESGLVVLEVIIGIAPLLGLLGTVSGLVAVFANLGTGTGETDPRGIALGISEALNTTIAGLAISIPSLIAFSYFSKKIETMAVEMESLVADLIAKLYSEPDPADLGSHEPISNAPISRRAGFESAGRRSALREPSKRKFDPAEPNLKRGQDASGRSDDTEIAQEPKQTSAEDQSEFPLLKDEPSASKNRPV